MQRGFFTSIDKNCDSFYAIIFLSLFFNRLLKGLYFHSLVCGACRSGFFFSSTPFSIFPIRGFFLLVHIIPNGDVMLHYCRQPHIDSICHHNRRILFLLALVVFPEFFTCLIAWVHISGILAAWLKWNFHVNLSVFPPFQDYLGTWFIRHHSIQSILPW